MDLTRLSVSKEIEFSFGRSKLEKLTEAKVLLMRDGKDIEDELKARGETLDSNDIYMQRSPLGDVEVIVKLKGLPAPIRTEWPSGDRV